MKSQLYSRKYVCRHSLKLPKMAQANKCKRFLSVKGIILWCMICNWLFNLCDALLWKTNFIKETNLLKIF